MNVGNRGLLRRVDYRIVAIAMAVLALALEWFVARSVRRAAKTGASGRARR
jgi:hypothetical protein